MLVRDMKVLRPVWRGFFLRQLPGFFRIQSSRDRFNGRHFFPIIEQRIVPYIFGEHLLEGFPPLHP